MSYKEGNTPTDDDRRVLIDAIRRSVAGTHGIQEYLAGKFADAALRAGFHRSEVPGSSAPARARGRSRGKHTDEQMLYMICLALEEGLEGVANIDLPDLIIKMISEHWGTADEDTSPEEAEAALAQLAPYIPDHMRNPEPQGDGDMTQKYRCEKCGASGIYEYMDEHPYLEHDGWDLDGDLPGWIVPINTEHSINADELDQIMREADGHWPTARSAILQRLTAEEIRMEVVARMQERAR